MGCECSKEGKPSPGDFLKGSFLTIESVPPSRNSVKQLLPEEKTTFKNITLAVNAIKKNDIFLMNRMLKRVKDGEFTLMSDVYKSFLNYAVRKNAYTSMDALISYLKHHSPQEYLTLIHSQDEDGRTLAMLCVFNDSAETLYILFKHCENLDSVSDNEGNTLLSLCQKYSKGCAIVYERMTSLKKKFLSLKEVLHALQRVKKLKTTIRQIILAKRAIEKLKSASLRKEGTTHTDLCDETNPPLEDRTSLIKKKTTRNFSRGVIWCKRIRTPGFDKKYARTAKGRMDSKGYSFLTMGSHIGERADGDFEDNDFKKFSYGKHHTQQKYTFHRKTDFDGNSDSDNDSEEYNEDEEDRSPNNDEFNPTTGDNDESDVFLFQRLAFLKTIKKQNHDPPQNSSTSRIMQRLQTNQSFQDMDFPAGNEIIGQEWIYKNNNLQVIWQRPHELFQTGFNNIHLFDSIDPDDIEQGMLGVCYLLAAISALAEFPSRVQNLFLNSQTNPKGVYGLQFYSQGVPTEITVDDYIPCSFQGPNNTLKPIFSRPKGNELWVLLVEKAWAKLFGSYSQIETGISDEAFEYILGVPSFMYLIEYQTTEKIWKRIYSADRKNYIISASTPSEIDPKLGLASSHTYSVISAHEIGGYRILKLRNPWARFEWKGDFSDNSKLWTPRIMQEVGYVNAEDGVFAMTVEDFQKHFMGFVIAEYHDDWNYTYIVGGNEPHHSEYFKFEITCPTEVYFRVHQRNERFQDTPGYAPADFRIAKIKDDGTFQPLVIKSGDVDDAAIFGHHAITPTRHHKLFLKTAGEYVVRVKMHWPNDQRGKFTLSAYSYHKIEFRQIKPIKNFLEKSFINIGRRARHREEFENDCFIVRGFSGFNHYIYAKNEGNYTWNLTMTFSDLENATLGKPYKSRYNQDTFQLILKPNEEKATYLKIMEPKTFESYIDPIFENEWTY